MGRDNQDDRNKIKRRKVSSSDKRTTSQTSSNSNRSNNRRKASNKKGSGRFKGVKTVALILLVLLVVCVAGFSGLIFASLKNTETINKAYLDKKTYQTTEILYADGNLLAKAETSNKKEPVSDISEISINLQHALIAAEDERFYEHNGVDIVGLGRAAFNFIKGNRQGGSTIPMQVSKMLITSQEQSITRKIKDIYYAFEMSKTVSKDDILLAYLNNCNIRKDTTKEGVIMYYDGLIESEVEYQYVRLKTTNNGENNYAHIYVSSTSEEPTYADSIDKSIEPNSLLFIPFSNFKENKAVKITIECNNICDYTLEYGLVNSIEIEDNVSIDIKVSINELFTMTYPIKEGENKKVLLTALSSGSNVFETTLKYGNDDVPFQKKFFNGYGNVLISGDNYVYKEGTPFILTIKPLYNGDIFTITSRILTSNTEENPITIAPKDKIISIVGIESKSGNIKNECFKIVNPRKLESESKYRYLLQGYSFNQNAFVYEYDAISKTIINGKNIEDTGYKTFELEDNSGKILICVKVNNDLNEMATIQFQVIDLDDIYETQQFTMPLIRGVPIKGFLEKDKLITGSFFSKINLFDQLNLPSNYIKIVETQYYTPHNVIIIQLIVNLSHI